MNASRSASGADNRKGSPPSEARALAKAKLLRESMVRAPLWLPVSGDSMGGALRGGARVRVEAGASPRAGEIWAFVAPNGRVIVHRCRGRRGPRFVFAGDGSGREELAPPAVIIGRVTAIAEQGRIRRALRWRRTVWLWTGGLRRARSIVKRVRGRARAHLEGWGW